MWLVKTWLGVGVAVLAVCACDSIADVPGNDTEIELRKLIVGLELHGDPANGHELPSIEEPLAQLGRKLFFSKSLGGDRDVACVSCHHPVLGGGDGLALSIGVGADDPDRLGPGRTHPDGDFTVPRNASTTFNLGLWKEGLFWDSRVERLPDGGIRTPDRDFGTADAEAGTSLSEAQTRFPVTSTAEMRGLEFEVDGSNADVRNALERRLADDARWAAEFGAVFGSAEITYARIASAMAAYEDSQVFTDTPWRAYVEGDADAIDDAAKRGALLFLRSVEEGGVGCASCHSGDFFTDEAFHAIAAPQIGRGKSDGATGTNDYGRARETIDRNDRFSFRTPTLLNVSATGPYLHSGAYDNLADVVRHHLDPQAALDSFNPLGVTMADAQSFQRNKQEMLDFLEVSGRGIEYFRSPVGYTSGQVQDLVAFLQTLTDPCVLDRACLDPWVADPITDDVDGHLLVAVDADGNPL
jgi:cytochrome c peroxidase